MSTARRIQLGILLVVLVAFAACGAGILVTVRSHLIGRVDGRLAAGAETLEQLADAADVDEQLALLRTVADQAERESALLAFSPDDELVLSIPSGSTGDDDPLPDLGRVGVDGLRDRFGDPFEVRAVTGSLDYRAVSVDLDGTVLVIATPLSEVSDTVSRLLFALAVSAAGALVIIGIGTSIVIHRAINPIDDMIDVAAAIGAGDLSQRIDTSSHDPEVRRLSDALNDMLHQLDDAFGRKDASEGQLRRFVADASHELRTPLSSIRGYSELYLTGAATDDDSVAKAMSRIQSEAVRTAGLVDDLLLLARLDQGRAPVLEDVDLGRLTSDCVSDARAVEPDRRIALDVKSASVVVRADEDGLRQVLLNLLANTRVHAPGAPVRVSVGIDDEFGVLIVRDEGPGLVEGAAAHVFDRFWRADEARNRKTGGSGLGLAITKAIVDAHGGTIDVETAPGAGAAFTVRIPRADERC